jgi:uncharacterized membrane protein (TIGR02234 family)
VADRRTFWPTVLAGASASALAAVASGRPWATASAEVAGTATDADAVGSDVAPLSLALSLVALAAWGAILVVRRRGRRVVSAVGLLASVGVVVTVALSKGEALDAAVELLVGEPGSGSATVTAWYYTALVTAAVAAVAFVVAMLRLAAWPEMAARYDAPGSQPGDRDQTDLWKALDEGHDPTA